MRCFSWVGKSIKWICMNCENSYLNVFMCIITGRYTGASKSQMEFDLSQLRGIYSAEQFKNVLLNIINTKFTDDFWNITLPNNLATSSATSPSMYAYYVENPLKVVPLIHSNLTPVKFSHSPFCLFLFSSYSSCPLCRVLH